MEKINVNIEMNEENLEAFAKKIYEHLSDVAVDDLKTAVLEDIDVKDDIDSYMRYDFDITDHLDGVTWSDYFETPEIDDSDIEDIGRRLLEAYSPVNNCSTGQAFTEAVGKAIRYLLLNDEYVDYLVKALERNNRAKMQQDIENEIRAKLSDELKNQHFAEFKAELEKLNTASVNEVNIITAQNHINNTTTFSY